MTIQLLWEVQKIQSPLGELFPSPITLATSILSTVQLIWTVANRVFFSKNTEVSYVAGALLNFTLGDHIALSAQVALVVRKFLKLLSVKETLRKSYKEFHICVSGEFPLPETNSWIRTAKRASFIFCSTKTLLSRIGDYALSLVDLTFSFAINFITHEDTKNSMVTNILECYNELKNDPAKIGKEIEEHHEFVDWLLAKLQAPIRATNISALLTSAVKTGIAVTDVAKNTLNQAETAFHTGAFVINTIIAPDHTYFIKTNPTTHSNDNKNIPHSSRKNKLRPYGERFLSTY